MKIALFGAQLWDRESFDAQDSPHWVVYHACRLTPETVQLAEGCDAACVFVNDEVTAEVLQSLSQFEVKLVLLRCAGFNNVDLSAAKELGITIARVPAYSPNAVAEHTMGLILALNRSLHKAYARVREGDFRLDGLSGFDLCERTVGVIGTGRIGATFCQIARGFGCRVIAYDVAADVECESNDVEYVELADLIEQSDIISLHCPLTPDTHHLINDNSIRQMKPGVMLINTSRGAIIDTPSVIRGLKSGHIGSLGIDVYEEEADLFFEDLSDTVIQDDVFSRLLTFPNVLITGHQAFFTSDALAQISSITLNNASEFEASGSCTNAVQDSPASVVTAEVVASEV